MIREFRSLMVYVSLILFACSNDGNKSSRSDLDDQFIESLIYHHEFAVSAAIDNYAEDNQIEKRIPTERVGGAQETNYWTPLCFAAFMGSRFGVEKLIEKGADVNFKDGNGQTPLLLASITGHIEVIDVLLKSDANINEKDINKSTALIHAAAEGNIQTVKYLIDKGCELKPEDGGLNALDFAVFYQQHEIADFLTAKGLVKSE